MQQNKSHGRAPADMNKQQAGAAKKQRRLKPGPRFSAILYKNPGPVSGGFVANLTIILVFGLIMLFSASYATGFYRFHDSYHYIRPQLFFALIGLVLMWAASRFDYHILKDFAWVAYGLSLALLCFVFTQEPIKGCKRWIHIKHLGTIQPSEIAKFAIILLIAYLYSRYGDKKIKTFTYGALSPAIWALIIMVLLYFEPHNSAMVLIAVIAASIMFAGGCKFRWFALVALAGGGGIAGIIYLTPGYVQERLSGWLDPFADMADSTLQTGQSLYTIGAGGLFGVGIGNSVQKHSWLPEAQNDFIFSILCEELGFVGAVVCIFLFAMLIVQGIIIAVRAPDQFGFLLVIGIVAQVAFQFLFNVAVVTNLLPNTGISLPFFSSGGTSLVMLLCEMGIVLSVSRAGNKQRMQQQEEKTSQQEIEPAE